MADDVAKGEVDRASEEDRRNRHVANTDEEAVEGPGVVRAHDASAIPDAFSDTTEDHGGREKGLASVDSLAEVDEAGESEQGEEAGVGGEGGTVIHD